ncbi:MAG TPA: hypothetical protein VK711_09375, partial [Puia sp.]|nr:hypothetical protein [Puia sp.]
MNTENKNILTINGGSSSIKASVYKSEKFPERIFSFQIERIGLSNPVLVYTEPQLQKKKSDSVIASNMTEAIDVLLHWLDEKNI